MFAEKHVEDDAVDRVVAAIVGEDADFRLVLTEAIHAALALLVARWIPAKVVVKDGIELALKVDAFGETIGANQHVLRRSAEGGDAGFTVGRRQCAGHGIDSDVLPEGIAEMSCNVVGGVDEPAEDDWAMAIGEEGFDVLCGLNQLLIGLSGKGFGAAGEGEEFAAIVLSGVFTGIGAGAQIQWRGIVGIVLIEDCSPADFVRLVFGLSIVNRGAAAERRDGGGGAG